MASLNTNTDQFSYLAQVFLNTYTFFKVVEAMFTVGNAVLNDCTMEFFLIFFMR